MKMRRLSCGLLMLLACGGKDGNIDSGLPPDKTGDQLMPAEKQTLCEASAEYLDARITDAEWTGYLCTLMSFGDAEGADIPARIESCKQLRAECVAEGQESLGGVCSDVDDWSTCGATVAEIEACLADQIDLLDGLIDDFTCDILDPARAMALQDKYGDQIQDPYPPSCDVVRAKCPQVLGGGDDVDEEEGGGEFDEFDPRVPARLGFTRR